VNKIKKKNIVYYLKILKFLYYENIFFSLIKKIYNFFFYNSQILNKKNLAFVYDLERNPTTFDFGHFLVQAEEERREKKLKFIDVFIIKLHSNYSVKMHDFYIKNSDHELNNRVHEIIYPITRLLKSVKNIMIIDENFFKYHKILQNYKYIFPNKYSITNRVSCKPATSKKDAKQFFPMFSPSERSLEIIEKYLKPIKKKIITITLRNSFYLGSRNSKNAEWIRFAKYLKKKNYHIMFIPDSINFSIKDKKIFKNFDVIDLVLWNPVLRAALYEKVFLNCSVVSGPIDICSAYNHKSNTLRILDVKKYPKKYLESCIKNWDELKSIPWSTENNKLVLTSEKFSELKKEFLIIEKNINDKR
jgi:hypothetical protein